MEYRSVTALADGSNIRVAQFEGRSHLVVPVVMLVGDSVLRPMHSTVPEFVPAELLAEVPEQWDGRPVVATHPGVGTGSANSPRTLDSMRFGTVFNSRFVRGALQGEAWINPERAESVGEDAERTIRELRRGQTVEVSVGAWVTLVEEEGVSPGGVAYGARWATLASDHLAVGLGGGQGACSVDMGCGAPRAASAVARRSAMRVADRDDDAEEEVLMGGKESWIGQALDRFLAAMSVFRADQGPSDSDLHDSLWQALRSAEPAFDGIAEVFQQDGIVVYVVSPDGGSVFRQRSFELDDSGGVRLGDESQEVAPRTKFEPLEVDLTGDDEISATAACGCPTAVECRCAATDDSGAEPGNEEQEDSQMADKDTTSADAVSAEISPEKRELVNLLIANKRAPFSETDYDALTAFSQSKLRELRDHYNPPPEPQTPEEWLESAPTEIRDAFRRMEAQEAQRKFELCELLKQAQDEYTLEQLRAKSTEELEPLARILGLDKPRPDYSGRGIPVRPEDYPQDPPNPYEAGLEKLRAKYEH